MKVEAKQKARQLRENGRSIHSIANELNVSSSSVSLWVRDIQLSKDQLQRLNANKDMTAVSRVFADMCLEKRKEWQAIGRKRAIDCEPDYAFNCALYWGEGSKTRNTIEITNTDSQLILNFLNFLRKYFGVVNEEVSLSLNIHLNNGMGLEEVEKYWCELLNVPKTCFRKSILKSNYYTSPARIKYPYGVCRLRVCRTDICQQILGSIKQFSGDMSDRWLS